MLVIKICTHFRCRAYLNGILYSFYYASDNKESKPNLHHSNILFLSDVGLAGTLKGDLLVQTHPVMFETVSKKESIKMVYLKDVFLF